MNPSLKIIIILVAALAYLKSIWARILKCLYNFRTVNMIKQKESFGKESLKIFIFNIVKN